MANLILETQYKIFYQKFAEEKVDKNQIVLLGDSMINYWDTSKFFDNDNIINRGIPGDTTKGVLKRLHQIIEIEPSVVIMSIGTNDIALINDSIENIVKRILSIKFEIEEKLPKTKVYILSSTPVLKNNKISNLNYILNRDNDIIDEINSELALFTKIIDVNSYLKDVNNDLKLEYTYDGIHLNEIGYTKYSEIVAKKIEELKLKKGIKNE